MTNKKVLKEWEEKEKEWKKEFPSLSKIYPWHTHSIGIEDVKKYLIEKKNLKSSHNSDFKKNSFKLMKMVEGLSDKNKRLLMEKMNKYLK